MLGRAWNLVPLSAFAFSPMVSRSPQGRHSQEQVRQIQGIGEKQFNSNLTHAITSGDDSIGLVAVWLTPSPELVWARSHSANASSGLEDVRGTISFPKQLVEKNH
jgi:hypothetical protein